MEVKRLLTADDLLLKGEQGPCELVKGELIRMARAGYGHGRLVAHLTDLMAQFVCSKSWVRRPASSFPEIPTRSERRM